MLTAFLTGQHEIILIIMNRIEDIKAFLKINTIYHFVILYSMLKLRAFTVPFVELFVGVFPKYKKIINILSTC